jgi:hypothetical protein
MMRLEELGKLKKLNNLIGTRTSDLPAFGIAPQPTTLSCAPFTRHVDLSNEY